VNKRSLQIFVTKSGFVGLMLRKQMLKYLKLRFYTLIINTFYKFLTYFLNFFTVLEVKVLDNRNWLTFIHNLYQ